MTGSNSYLLLTGATGLLGRSLLRDLSARGRRIAVLVRSSKTAHAVSRVDEILQDWREVAGVEVPCPVVLEGDITSAGLGLSSDQAAWVARNVDEVVHCAASLSFQMRESDGEPWNSNVHGTAHVLEMCRVSGIKRLHHVSSAYVCGLRRGKILETELDVGQTPGNDYERSKIASEKAAVDAPFLDVCTVHRPSIIVGDLVTGFTNTFHGFYKPLRIIQPFVQAFVDAALESGSLLDVLGMKGDEKKNLVTVDWVSAVMTRIIGDRSLHGRTYHLTATKPTSVAALCRVFEQLAGEMAQSHEQEKLESLAAGKPAAVFDPAMLVRLFGDQMHVYRAYWSDDPQFDSTEVSRIAPDIPSPALDEQTLMRLCRFAITNKFRWPPPSRQQRQTSARHWLEQIVGEPQWSPPSGSSALGIAAIGAGGGQWTLCCDQRRALSLHVGLPGVDVPTMWLASKTLEDLLTGRESADSIHARGGSAIEAPDRARCDDAMGIMRQLTLPLAARHRPVQPA